MLVGACNHYEHCENFTEIPWQLYYTLLPPVPRQKVVRSWWLPTPGHGDNDGMAAAWPQTPVISSGAYNHPCTCHYPQNRNITNPAHCTLVSSALKYNLGKLTIAILAAQTRVPGINTSEVGGLTLFWQRTQWSSLRWWVIVPRTRLVYLACRSKYSQ